MKTTWLGTMVLVIVTAGAVSGGMWMLMPAVAPFVSGMRVTSGVPAAINHQDLVTVNGSRFNGTGSFKFAIIDPDTGLNRWTSDGTNLNNSAAPTGSVSLQVTDGVYSTRLGASPMPAISADIFADDNLQLRIWFDDGVNGNKQLLPDHVLASVPYALAVADNVVTTAKLADGAVTAVKIADGSINTAKLASDVQLVPTGTIVATARATAPSGWLLCDGSAVSRTTYAALFAAIGTAYGAGDGSLTFNLPDLRGRVPLALDNMGGTDAGRLSAANTLGGSGGEEKHTLTTAEIPAHNHSITDPGHNHNSGWLSSTSGGSVGWIGSTGTVGWATTSVNGTGIAINNTGGGAAHNVMPPYLFVNYVIKQ